MKSRIFLFPGFGENERCFRNLKPFLRAHEIVDVDFRPCLNKLSIKDTTPTALAKEIIKHYGIESNDLLVGHSMGGYFAYIIGLLQGNSTCLIGSFSDPNKIIRFTDNKLFTIIVAGSGFIKTPMMAKYIANGTRDNRSKTEMLAIHKNFKSFSNKEMGQLASLSFGEELPPTFNQPLRIHAKDDNVVRTPDEPYERVRGGHFCLIFHPDEVHTKMKPWLEK